MMKKLSLLEAVDDEHDSTIRMFNRMKNYNPKNPNSNSIAPFVKKANDLIYQMTAEFNDDIDPKEILDLLHEYFKARNMGTPEPHEKIDGKTCDYLAGQIYNYLIRGDR